MIAQPARGYLVYIAHFRRVRQAGRGFRNARTGTFYAGVSNLAQNQGPRRVMVDMAEMRKSAAPSELFVRSPQKRDRSAHGEKERRWIDDATRSLPVPRSH